jgi:hypothetical protein
LRHQSALGKKERLLGGIQKPFKFITGKPYILTALRRCQISPDLAGLVAEWISTGLAFPMDVCR